MLLFGASEKKTKNLSAAFIKEVTHGTGQAWVFLFQN